MIYKVVGALIIGAAAALAFITLQDEAGLSTSPKSEAKQQACVQLTPAQLLNKMINDDFQELANTQQLPPEWSSIATVEIRMNSELAKALLGKQRPSIQRVREGKAFLELEVMDLPDEENPGLIVQASLFDIKSKNKIFEIGRTYTMNDLNKIAPPSTKASADRSTNPDANAGAARAAAEKLAAQGTAAPAPTADSNSNAAAAGSNPVAAVPGAAPHAASTPAANNQPPSAPQAPAHNGAAATPQPPGNPSVKNQPVMTPPSAPSPQRK